MLFILFKNVKMPTIVETLELSIKMFYNLGARSHVGAKCPAFLDLDENFKDLLPCW